MYSTGYLHNIQYCGNNIHEKAADQQQWLLNFIYDLQIMAYIKHAILAQKALPVAPHVINKWVINRSVNEADFTPDLEEPSSSAVLNTLPPASVLAIITVEPSSGRVLGSH